MVSEYAVVVAADHRTLYGRHVISRYMLSYYLKVIRGKEIRLERLTKCMQTHECGVCHFQV
jgi:hypothetical protein